jgi:hypothetical protein
MTKVDRVGVEPTTSAIFNLEIFRIQKSAVNNKYVICYTDDPSLRLTRSTVGGMRI